MYVRGGVEIPVINIVTWIYVRTYNNLLRNLSFTGVVGGLRFVLTGQKHLWSLVCYNDLQ